MEKFTTGFLLCIVILCFGCASSRKTDCLRNEIDHHKFVTPGQDNFYTMNGKDYAEYAGGTLYAKSEITWIDCSTYQLVIKEKHYDVGFPLGDTVRVKVLGIDKDTVRLSMAADGHSALLKVIRQGKIKTIPTN